MKRAITLLGLVGLLGCGGSESDPGPKPDPTYYECTCQIGDGGSLVTWLPYPTTEPERVALATCEASTGLHCTSCVCQPYWTH